MAQTCLGCRQGRDRLPRACLGLKQEPGVFTGLVLTIAPALPPRDAARSIFLDTGNENRYSVLGALCLRRPKKFEIAWTAARRMGFFGRGVHQKGRTV